jgi:hypothetical protein
MKEEGRMTIAIRAKSWGISGERESRRERRELTLTRAAPYNPVIPSTRKTKKEERRSGRREEDDLRDRWSRSTCRVVSPEMRPVSTL